MASSDEAFITAAAVDVRFIVINWLTLEESRRDRRQQVYTLSGSRRTKVRRYESTSVLPYYLQCTVSLVYLAVALISYFSTAMSLFVVHVLRRAASSRVACTIRVPLLILYSVQYV